MIQFSVHYPAEMSDDEVRASVRELGLGALEWDDEKAIEEAPGCLCRIALIECPEETWAELEENGEIELTDDVIVLNAEMP